MTSREAIQRWLNELTTGDPSTATDTSGDQPGHKHCGK
jgi:hypothetical protein